MKRKVPLRFLEKTYLSLTKFINKKNQHLQYQINISRCIMEYVLVYLFGIEYVWIFFYKRNKFDSLPYIWKGVQVIHVDIWYSEQFTLNKTNNPK
jgi:hypothetical protein